MFGQPFSDTPANLGAHGAITDLAARGLIEGYPDGTFKGDRAMTRYEMAMVIAGLLTRIEALQVPPPGAPAAASDQGQHQRYPPLGTGVPRGVDRDERSGGVGRGRAQRDQESPLATSESPAPFTLETASQFQIFNNSNFGFGG